MSFQLNNLPAKTCPTADQLCSASAKELNHWLTHLYIDLPYLNNLDISGFFEKVYPVKVQNDSFTFAQLTSEALVALKETAQEKLGRNPVIEESLAIVCLAIYAAKLDDNLFKEAGPLPSTPNFSASALIGELGDKWQLDQGKISKIDYLVHNLRKAHTWESPDEQTRNNVLQSGQLQSLALLQEAHAKTFPIYNPDKNYYRKSRWSDIIPPVQSTMADLTLPQR